MQYSAAAAAAVAVGPRTSLSDAQLASVIYLAYAPLSDLKALLQFPGL